MSYSPTLGRFLECDPIGYDDGMNPYQFAGANPVGNVDPTGLKADLKLDLHPEVDADLIPDAPGADGKVDQDLKFDYEILPSKDGKFKCQLHIKATLTVLMRIRSEAKGLKGDLREKVIKHEYAHYNTYVKGMWPKIEKLKWFDGKRFFTTDRAKEAGEKLKAEVNAYYGKAIAHSERFDPFKARRNKLVTYNERPFNEDLITNDIPLDE